MIDFMIEGGYGTWLVLIFGLASLVLAVWYAISLRRDLMPLVVGLGLATIIMYVDLRRWASS